MRKGQKVKIYQKPLTQEDFEGEAVLVKQLTNKQYGINHLQKWVVEFEDGMKVERRIKI
jgi:hypothetical protein